MARFLRLFQCWFGIFVVFVGLCHFFESGNYVLVHSFIDPLYQWWELCYFGTSSLLPILDIEGSGYCYEKMIGGAGIWVQSCNANCFYLLEAMHHNQPSSKSWMECEFSWNNQRMARIIKLWLGSKKVKVKVKTCAREKAQWRRGLGKWKWK